MPPRIRYTYDPKSARYRERTSGKFVSPQTVRAGIDAIIRASEARIVTLTDQFRTRAINLGQWEQGMRGELRALHVAAAISAKGGRDEMAPSDWGAVGAKLKRQYQYLAKRATLIGSGKQLPDGSLTNRARMYAKAALPTYLATRGDELTLRGFTEIRSIVHARESCAGCLAQQAKGFQPESVYIPIGARDCLTSCACTELRRNPITGEIAA